MNQKPSPTPNYKSFSKLLFICLNASLATFFAGYAFVYAGLLTVHDFNLAIINHYGFNKWQWSQSSYKSIIQGTVPLGAIFGALFSSIILARFSRKNGILVTNVITFLATIFLINSPTPLIFLIMRFIQGICLGIYDAIIPLYINQMQTIDSSSLGSLSQISMAFAQLFCCIISFIFTAVFHHVTSQQRAATLTWLVLAAFPLITILAQSLMIHFLYPYDTVKYLRQNGLMDKAKQLAQHLYSQDYAKQILQQPKPLPTEIQMQTKPELQKSLLKQPQPHSSTPKLQTSKIAIYFAIHMAALQQMSGINAIVVYGKNTFEQALSGHETILQWSTIGLFALCLISTLITVKLMNRLGRKTLMQVGTSICTICLALTAWSFYKKGQKSYNQSEQQSNTIIFSTCIYMFFYGMSLGPIVWLYIPQIVQPHIIPYTTMTNLLFGALSVILFPIIANNKNVKYVPFIIFFIWCFISLFINHKFMIQTKNQSRNQVFQKFKKFQQHKLL